MRADRSEMMTESVGEPTGFSLFEVYCLCILEQTRAVTSPFFDLSHPSSTMNLCIEKILSFSASLIGIKHKTLASLAQKLHIKTVFPTFKGSRSDLVENEGIF
jgi:hypothetical protein